MVARLGAARPGAVHLGAFRPVVCPLVAFLQAVILPVARLPAVCRWAARPEIGKAFWKKVVRRRA